MAHMLNKVKGKVAMFYTGEVPWHQLGQHLDNPATAEEAIVAAKLDYTITQTDVFAAGVTNTLPLEPIRGYQANIRIDTNEVLGIVSSRYHVIQNKQAFTFFDHIVGEGQAIFHTAGALGKGERIWILAKLPGTIRVTKKDNVEKFLLLYNSHDGSSAVRVRFTPIRVVCNNTLRAALAGSSAEVRIRHTKTATQQLKTAHHVLGISGTVFHNSEIAYQAMAEKQMSAEDLLSYVKRLVPTDDDKEEHAHAERVRNVILQLHEEGVGAELARGTVWGAYNAATEYADHMVPVKQNPHKHLKSMWWGEREGLRKRAFELALQCL